MKIQIISKLVQQGNHTQRQPKQTSLQEHLKDTHRKHRQLNYHVQTQYYPMDSPIKKIQQTREANQYLLFFNNFQRNTSVIYEKVKREQSQVRKQLQPILSSIKKVPEQSPKRSDYEFSFNKKQSTASTMHSPTLKTENDSSRVYFLNSKPKTKLRKFSSLIALKCREQQKQAPSFQGQKIVLRKNASLMKYEESNFMKKKLPYGSSILSREEESLNCECEEMRVEKKTSVQTDRMYAQEKERLAKIRKQLNEIYQMRKPQLKIF